VEFAVPLIWYGKLLGESGPGARRKEENLNVVGVCLADCASYLNSPLRAITLVRSTITMLGVVSTPPQWMIRRDGTIDSSQR
jgi:hypothetical protein